MIKFLTAISVLVCISGCASNINDPDSKTDIEIVQGFIATQKLESVRLVRTSSLGGWEIIDNKYLVANNSRTQSVLIELRTRCAGMDAIYDIVGLNRMSQSTLTTSDSAFVPDMPLIRCPIKSLYPISHEQRDVLLAELQ